MKMYQENMFSKHQNFNLFQNELGDIKKMIKDVKEGNELQLEAVINEVLEIRKKNRNKREKKWAIKN